MVESTEFLEKLRLWNEAKLAAAKFTDIESALRLEVYALAFPKQASVIDTKGTFYEDLPNGWKIKAEAKMTAKLDEAAVPAIKEKLLELKVSNVDALFNYKPSLVAAEFKKLNDVSKAIVSEAITETPAKVTITLVETKKET